MINFGDFTKENMKKKKNIIQIGHKFFVSSMQNINNQRLWILKKKFIT